MCDALKNFKKNCSMLEDSNLWVHLFKKDIEYNEMFNDIFILNRRHWNKKGRR